MVAARWPCYFYSISFDPDEAQIVAAAQTLATEPILYRMAEGATAGPLVIYCAGIPWIFGKVPSLFVARLIAVLLAWIGVSAIYLGIRRTGVELAARMAAMAAALFYGFTEFWNFVHYNSEMLPSMLCAISTACLISMFQVDNERDQQFWRKSACLAAMLLSLVPFAKLQVAPLGLSIGLLVYARGVWILRGQWVSIMRYTVQLALSVLAFPVIFVLVIIFAGESDYFYHSYIVNNFLYAGSGYCSRLSVVEKLLTNGSDMNPWMGGVLMTLIAVWIIGMVTRRGMKSKAGSVAFICIALAVVSGYCVLAPARDYFHYLLLIPIPLSFAMGAMMAWMLEANHGPAFSRAIVFFTPLILFAALTPYFIHEGQSGMPWAGSSRYWSCKPLDGIRAELKRRSNLPSDGMLVWGYVPDLHVTTGILQASRLSVTSAQIQQGALTPFYRKTLMKDITRKHPRFIVDAVCPKGFIYTDNSRYGPHCFPEFNQFLKSYYKPVGIYSDMKLYEKIE